MAATDTITRAGWVRFRCACGRSVATPDGSEAAEQRRCRRCRTRVGRALGL